jgi:ATP-binding cassette, subfamily B, multidrug efflux pump
MTAPDLTDPTRDPVTNTTKKGFFAWFENRVFAYPQAAPALPPNTFFAFLWHGTRGLRPYIAWMTVLTALIGAFEAFQFAMLGYVVDAMANVPAAQWWATEKQSLLILAGLLLASPVIVALQALLKYQSVFATMPMRLRWNFHRLMLGQSLSFYQDEFAGRVATKVMQTSLAVRDVWLIVADIMVFVVIYFVTMTAVVGRLDLWLLLPFVAWLVFYVTLLCVCVPRLGAIAKAQADARSLMTGRITDAYTNITTVKLFSHANREAGYARSSMQEFMTTAYQQMRLVTVFEICNHVLTVSLILSTSGVCFWLWIKGDVGAGAVAAATAMALRLNGMAHWIMWEMASLFEHIGTVQDGMGTLAKAHTVLDKPGAPALAVPRGEVHFDNVTFGYGQPKNVIEKFSLRIKPGEKIGLVGRSGAGKSTIVNLLLRFYDVADGRVLIDGQNIADVTQETLRAQVGMVTQDTSLLHRSVRDNILYGKPQAGDEDMVAAAKRAHAHDFIQTLTDPKERKGYDAHVGERGVKLSGGQRQRIAIARVMLKDAPILLLDEATSALDSEVESAIQQSLFSLMEGKTVIAIAHRLSTIAAMDRLIVMDQGHVVEEGSHAQLLAQGGLYAKLWTHQSGGFLLDDGGPALRAKTAEDEDEAVA